MFNGKGVYSWWDGKTYTGEFKNGEMHGNGKCTYPDHKSYIGEYKNGKKDGIGEQIWDDYGKKYSGEWKAGKMHGKGTYQNIKKGKEARIGIFEKGKLVRWVKQKKNKEESKQN